MINLKNISTSEKAGTPRKRRTIPIAVLAIVAFLAVFNSETQEILQVIPAVPGVISSIGNGIAAEKADLKPVKAAIIASTPRVTSVELSNRHDGFAEVVNVTLFVKESSPIRQEELLAVLKALWRTVPFEPTYIVLEAKTQSRENVDVKNASSTFAGVTVGDYGSYTVTLKKLDKLLGPWENPR